eukprot:431773-Amphidinium_carterae.1
MPFESGHKALRELHFRVALHNRQGGRGVRGDCRNLLLRGMLLKNLQRFALSGVLDRILVGLLSTTLVYGLDKRRQLKHIVRDAPDTRSQIFYGRAFSRAWKRCFAMGWSPGALRCWAGGAVEWILGWAASVMTV